LRNHSALATRVLRIFIGRIERELRRSAAAPAHARLGAASFLQRVGSALNEHWHHHCCLSDSVFAAATSQSLAFVFAAVAPTGKPGSRRGPDGGCWRRTVGIACWTRKPPRTWPTRSTREDSRSTPHAPPRGSARPQNPETATPGPWRLTSAVLAAASDRRERTWPAKVTVIGQRKC